MEKCSKCGQTIKSKTEMISIRIPEKTKSRLDKLADNAGIPTSHVLRNLIEDHVTFAAPGVPRDWRPASTWRKKRRKPNHKL